MKPAKRQIEAAKQYGYEIEWLVSDKKAVEHLQKYFKQENININVKLLEE